MAQATDFTIANASFPTVRSDINTVLSAINTMNSGTSRPSSAVAGTMWLDTTSASSPTIKFFDGSDDISFATIDYSANTVNFLDSTVVADILGDTTPQLGGQLDVNGNSIGDGTRELIKFIETASAVNEVSVTNSATGNAPELSATGDDTNIDLKLTPKGSGKLNLDGITFPNADGSANQVLTTNGSGVLSFADASAGGTSWQSAVKTANFTAVAGEGYFVNTAGGAFEIDLPGSPSVGDEIEFVDFSRSFATNNLTLDQGSNKFQGNATTPKPVYDTNGQNIKIVYSGSTQGWIPLVDDDVTFETPQTYSADFLVIAGGGGGGTSVGGGGGAGGYRNSFSSESSGGGGSSETTLALSAGTVYTVTVGAAGAGGGTSGGSSSISGSDITDITSSGGGGGSGGSTNNGLDGGSGGGGKGGSSPGSGGSGTANQGFDGGNGSSASADQCSGGGGGASAAGSNGAGNAGGNGGAGLASSITASAVTRAGGGGGSGRNNGTPGSGGSGGGGGGAALSSSATAGTTNTGSGGGGAHDVAGANGGSGVVILRVPTADYSGTTSGSPTVTTSGSDTILLFNASGSYTG